MATLSLDANSYGEIALIDSANGRARIQFRAPLPPANPDPFAPGMYWHECEVVLSEVTTTQFFGKLRIEESMFSETE